jgi:hypothetical protein
LLYQRKGGDGFGGVECGRLELSCCLVAAKALTVWLRAVAALLIQEGCLRPLVTLMMTGNVMAQTESVSLLAVLCVRDPHQPQMWGTNRTVEG